MIEIFRALAEPGRLQIVELLLRESLPVGVVAARLGMRQPQVSKHLRWLSESGLVEMRPDAQRRIYGLRGQAFLEMNVWVERYRDVWEAQFDRLDGVLEELGDG
ncbi:MAG: metalloregulator ArsR/SmtB family transcription factor [Bryobacteraceae bacterium]|nr:metalloregulator ArsR/SmtB family transcription factor [Bryobacteraceae bacterium]